MKKPRAKQARCEVKTEFCSGQCVAHYKGVEDDDPEFDCCIACAAILRKGGARFVQCVRNGVHGAEVA